jgi:hypothetical protein
MKSRGLGPHSRRHRPGYLDGRTFEARLYKQFRDDLIAHVGGTPSIPQIAIIERCAWIRVRLALMDTKIANGEMTEQDSHCYLAWANTLTRLLARLGLEPAGAKPVDPADFLAVRSRGRAIGDILEKGAA